MDVDVPDGDADVDVDGLLKCYCLLWVRGLLESVGFSRILLLLLSCNKSLVKYRDRDHLINKSLPNTNG